MEKLTRGLYSGLIPDVKEKQLYVGHLVSNHILNNTPREFNMIEIILRLRQYVKSSGHCGFYFS